MPDPLVCVGVFTAVAVFSAVTWAPTTTAPLESITWPVIAPVTVWPEAGDVHRSATTEQANQNCKQDCVFVVVISSLIRVSWAPRRGRLRSWSENIGDFKLQVKRKVIDLT